MQKIFNITGNSIYAEKLYNFIIEYKNIILISFFFGVFVNAIDIFTIKYGMDSELYAYMGDGVYIEQQRYGSYLLYHLLPFARYHIISQLVGLMALTLAGLLTISRHNISKEAKLLFILLFIVCPNFTFLQYFYFQSAYNFISLLFVVISYRLIEHSKNILLYILALILLYIGISSYQPNFAVYLTVMMINIILDYINQQNYRLSIKQIFKGTIFLVIATIIYYISIKIIATNLNSYHAGYYRHFSNIVQEFSNITTYIYRILFSIGFHGEDTANLVITIIVLLYFFIIIVQKKLKQSLFFIFLTILFFLSIFSLNIVLSLVLSRAMLAIAFYPAFVIMLLYYFNSNNKLKYIAILITIIIFCYNTTQIVKYQYTYYLSYKHDEFIVRDIMSKLYNKYPDIYTGKYKFAVVGELYKRENHPLTSFVANNNYHPLLNKKDFFGYSFFIGGHTERILAFMQLEGFPMNVTPVFNIDSQLDIKQKIEKMPVYPNNNCIQLFGDTVVVKLGN